MKNCIILLLIFLTTSLSANQIPLEHFTKHGDYLDMKLSPDGKHIAARLRADIGVMMVVIETETMQLISTLSPKNNDMIHSMEWINNERIVFQYALQTRHLDIPLATGELFAVDYDGRNNDMLFGFRAAEVQTGTRVQKREQSKSSARIVSLLPEDDKHILIAEYPFEHRGNFYYNNRKLEPTLVRLNVYNGRKTRVEYIPFKSSTVFATPNGDAHFVGYRGEDAKIHAAFRVSVNDDWQNLSDILDGDYVPQALSEDGKKLYLWGDFGDRKISTLFEFELATQKLQPLFDDMTTDIEYYIQDQTSQRPVVGISYPSTATYHYQNSDSQTEKWHKALAAGFGGQRLMIESQSDDGKLLLLHVTSDMNPGEYYLFDTETKHARFLWANRSWLDPNQLAVTTHFSFTTNDDLLVHGLVTLPRGMQDDDKAPFVTMIHGGPHGIRDFPVFDSEVQLLANRGYAVIQINFRGSGGYGSIFQEAGYHRWGSSMIQDIIEGTQTAINKFPLNPDAGCVYGGSYGGYAAMMAVITAPDMFKCVVGYVGLYNLEYMFTESDVATNYGGIAYLERAVGRDETLWKQYSPVYHADKIKANVMIIHGDKDSRVPVINAERMIEALEVAGNKPDYLNFGRSGHGVYYEEGRAELYKALLEFLEKNIQ